MDVSGARNRHVVTDQDAEELGGAGEIDIGIRRDDGAVESGRARDKELTARRVDRQVLRVLRGVDDTAAGEAMRSVFKKRSKIKSYLSGSSSVIPKQ